MICFPNAKINIGLRVIEKRSDNYHNIESVIYPLKGIMYDALEIIESQSPPTRGTESVLWRTTLPKGKGEGRTEIFISGISIPSNTENNLCVKAYNLLKKDFKLPPVKIYLHKVIPIGAGLGGGSADGAFMLKLLNEKFKLKLSEKKLMNYASKLGSDCPFFIRNEPAYVCGKGEKISLCKIDLSNYRIKVIYPNIHISTAEAYSLVKPKQPETSLKELISLPIEDWKNKIVNDFEEPIFSKYPQIKKLKEEMYKKGALYASMSGSGSAVYGIFKN